MAQPMTEPAAAGVASLEAEAVGRFRAAMRGETFAPGDGGYEAARAVWNGLIDRRPGLIVRCTGAADVIDAVGFAREHGLLVAVRGGGHNVAGTAVCDGGLVIDLSAMRGVRVDPAAGTARGGGATWGDLDRETQAFGLATAGGVVSTTGIAGLTLGGGLGWLRRAHGLSCDNVVSFDVVTADSRLRTVSETREPDLFWALRGGGGNFGVVTSFEYRLHPVGPMVTLCAPLYAAEPPDAAARVLRAWRDAVAEAPDEITAEALFWTVPAAPDFPEEAHGRRVIVLPAVSIAPPEEAERSLAPLRELGEPVADLSGPIPWVALQTAFDALFPAGELRYYWKSLYLSALGDDVIDVLVARAVDRPSPATLVAVWLLGGAMARVPAEATAFGRRDAPFMISVDSTWAEPAESERNVAWTRELWSDLQAFSSGGVYLNFPGLGEEREALVRAAYGDNYARLVELKGRYDPTNLFRSNQNIPPAA
jgi:FAD/FMN-containing dehydrogenase